MASTDATSSEFLESLEFEEVPKRGNTPRSLSRQAVERRVRRKLAYGDTWLSRRFGVYYVCAIVDSFDDLADLAQELGVIKEGQVITDD